MDWEPAHADHSIDNVNALFTFVEPIDSDSFDELIIPVRRAAAAHNFARRIETQEPSEMLQLAPGQFTVNVGGTPTRRVAFQRLDGSDVVSEFSIGVRSLTLWTHRYRRWANFFSELKDFIRAIEGAWSVSQKVKSISLQYMDRFLSIPGGASHFQVLASDSKSLVIPQKDPTAAFHVHAGWFDYETVPGVRVLTNINIDAGDVRSPGHAEHRRNITFLTLMQHEALNSSLPSPLEQADGLHRRLQNLFRELISREAAARVGLQEKP